MYLYRQRDEIGYTNADMSMILLFFPLSLLPLMLMLGQGWPEKGTTTIKLVLCVKSVFCNW